MRVLFAALASWAIVAGVCAVVWLPEWRLGLLIGTLICAVAVLALGLVTLWAWAV